MMRIGSIATTLPPLLLALVLGCGESFGGVGAAALGAEAGEPAGGALGVTAGSGAGGTTTVAGSESAGAGVPAGGAGAGGAVGAAGHATAGGMAPQAGAAAGGLGGSTAAGGASSAGSAAQAGSGAAGSGGAAPECAILKTKSDCAGCEISFERCGSPPTAARWLTSAPSGLTFECSSAEPLDCADAEARAKFWLTNECCKP